MMRLLLPEMCDPPHAVVSELRVNKLVASMRSYGWSGNPLVGYLQNDNGRVQLLSGTHRREAAGIVGIRIPAIIYSEVYACGVWGTDEWHKMMGRRMTDTPIGRRCESYTDMVWEEPNGWYFNPVKGPPHGPFATMDQAWDALEDDLDNWEQYD